MATIYIRDKKTGVYYVAYTVHGHRRHRSLKTTNHRAALQEKRRIENTIEALDVDPDAIPTSVSVAKVCAAFLAFAETRFANARNTLDTITLVMDDLKTHAGAKPAASFGPKALRNLRQVWIDRRLSRGVVNRYVSTVRRAFKFAVAEELLPATAWHRLTAVEGLRAGESKARELAPVRALTDHEIDAIEPHVSPTVWRMVQLQRFTGCRPGELLSLRTTDIDRTGAIWTARLDAHKTAHTGRHRIICFGPRAQAVLMELFAYRPIGAPLFDPHDALRDRYADADCHRRKNQKPKPCKTTRKVRETYSVKAYHHAVVRGCAAATEAARKLDPNAPAIRWTPHQLRHTAATRARAQFGLEAAQALLGHSNARITEVYAEVDKARAIEVVKAIG